MANFHQGGGAEAVHVSMYGLDTQDTIDFVRSHIDRPTNNWRETASHFIDSMYNTYERFSGSTAMRLAKAATRQLRGAFRANRVRYLRTIDELQAPPLEMIPYVMLEPTVRRRFQEQRCEGYNGEYRDLYADRKLEDHPLYQRVMDGMVVDSEDGFEWTEYAPSQFDDGDDNLDIEEQTDIIRTWETMAAKMLGDEDPTSRFNSAL